MAIIPERKEYNQSHLIERDFSADPIEQFRRWYEVAVAEGLDEPNTMTLASADVEGRPSARIVLLKQFDERGFCVFTNYQSRKGLELEANPFAALVFFWQPLERQVRVEGRVERVSEAESDAYFRSRPPGTRLGTWASEQSRVVPGREAFEDRLLELRDRHPDGNIPRPPHWGGYRVVPEMVEFWQGRASRLHDRFRYRRNETGGWIIERLAP
ncbi:pyridoxamine 5'-phosphate oxidase [soil metagenome]